jgi:hypothetical protein
MAVRSLLARPNGNRAQYLLVMAKSVTRCTRMVDAESNVPRDVISLPTIDPLRRPR